MIMISNGEVEPSSSEPLVRQMDLDGPVFQLLIDLLLLLLLPLLLVVVLLPEGVGLSLQPLELDLVLLQGAPQHLDLFEHSLHVLLLLEESLLVRGNQLLLLHRRLPLEDLLQVLELLLFALELLLLVLDFFGL